MANPIGDAEAPHKTSADIHAAGNETVIEGQKKALELAVHGAPLSAVLDTIVRTVETQSSNDVLGSILLFDAEAKRLRHGAAPSLPDAYNAAINGIAVGPAVSSGRPGARPRERAAAPPPRRASHRAAHAPGSA